MGDSVWWINTIGQAGFGAWTEYWQRLNIVRDDRAQRYVDWLKSGVWYSLYFENAVFLCGAPDHVGRDERGRLHSSEGPAMRWDDGWSIYAWHGVRVPAKYIDTPDSLGREDLLAEKNAERRRAMMEIVGSDRFSSLFDLEEVSRQRRHPELEEDVLLRTRTTDAVTGEHIQFVRVVCPSTGRVYHLCVPPSILTAAEAVAWTFGHDEQTFAPAVEA